MRCDHPDPIAHQGKIACPDCNLYLVALGDPEDTPPDEVKRWILDQNKGRY